MSPGNRVQLLALDSREFRQLTNAKTAKIYADAVPGLRFRCRQVAISCGDAFQLRHLVACRGRLTHIAARMRPAPASK